MKKAAIGITSFPEMIRGGYNYIDKTRYVYYLSKYGGHFSLFRPDGFGKTLFCSTLAAAYKGEKDLFKGLLLESSDYDFKKRIVFFLEFSKLGKPSSIEEFREKLCAMIQEQAEEQGVAVEPSGIPGSMLNKIIHDVDYEMKMEIGVIIDDFDALVASLALDNPELAKKVRQELSYIGSVIKGNAHILPFFLLTGTTKYTNTSIFSGMNHLHDISDDNYFSPATGYTDDDLERFFGEEIDENWRNGYGSREEFISEIKSYYGGYRFARSKGIEVCNPSSVNRFFSNNCVFRNYWQMSGISSLACNLCRCLKESDLYKDGLFLSRNSIYGFDISLLAGDKNLRQFATLMLYFSGLFVADDQEDYEYIIQLKIPNREVREALQNEFKARMPEIMKIVLN